MTPNDILNLNKYNMRHKDKFVLILKTPYMTFTLGEWRFHSWVMGEIEINCYTYICKCLNYHIKDLVVIDKVDYKVYKIYIDDVKLQDEIYLMQDSEYNRRLNYEKQNPEEVQEV